MFEVFFCVVNRQHNILKFLNDSIQKIIFHKKMSSYITFGIALILAVGTANGLQCYSCNSKDSTACAWSLASFTYNTEECQSAGFLNSLVGPKCYKIEAKDANGAEYIARGCQNPPAFGCDTIAKTAGWLSGASGQDLQIQCSTCDTDKCNSASKLAGFTVFGLLLATLAFLF